VYSPSAEVQGHGPGQEVLQTGKRDVGIVTMEPVGNYALKPFFSDGHESGLYTWEYLYELGKQDALWADYLARWRRPVWTATRPCPARPAAAAAARAVAAAAAPRPGRQRWRLRQRFGCGADPATPRGDGRNLTPYSSQFFCGAIVKVACAARRKRLSRLEMPCCTTGLSLYEPPGAAYILSYEHHTFRFPDR
jgi:hypothetical protein